MKKNSFVSVISGVEFPLSERVSCQFVSLSILDLIRQDYPGITDDDSISLSELNLYREKYIANYLSRGLGELSQLESNVMNSLNENKLLVNQIDDLPAHLSLGQRVADRVADFGGSWTFIISFGFFILIWIGLNVYWFANKGFDPYPFILLNLILSCIAALQAPVIMMSQNRQEEKDRERARNDYMINLKSELEIRMLHEKLDHLMLHQQQELIEIQKVQIEMMNDILSKMQSEH
ncbi:DUF1003 domain-containing protein [Flavobacterium sp. CYK-55]|uniref:DUF1003 domain-containing protein n=1 Tax=Flavobacterium sp. CYK-55 TaxID=2835529 RepID=UPI001BCD83C1|nr:DUF1003 domain-containing protein [Flavobacterium sp. CYK-55]MBS7786950.1 DUF1003 domain-containing protein [Flavobacterium sp. CYK-55]